MDGDLSLTETEFNRLAGETCRLCGGKTQSKFGLQILRRHLVQYYQCTECRSLQTEDPHWLGEAYDQNLSKLDTGAGQRNISNLAACYAVARIFSVRNVLEIGGGDGLLCRLLRDYGLNCFVQDKYAEPTYAQGFTTPNFTKPDLLLAFEVIEHFQNPAEDLNGLFKFDSDLLLLSTAVYYGEMEGWWYLSPESGQHIFFYGYEALQLIAQRYDYELILSGTYILFAKKRLLSRSKTLCLKLLLKPWMNRLIKAFVVLLPCPGVWKDHIAQKATT